MGRIGPDAERLTMIKTISAETIHFAIAEKIAAGVPYIEALCDYAQTEGVEIETLAAIVKKSEVIREKIRGEAQALNMIKRDPDERRLFD